MWPFSSKFSYPSYLFLINYIDYKSFYPYSKRFCVYCQYNFKVYASLDLLKDKYFKTSHIQWLLWPSSPKFSYLSYAFQIIYIDYITFYTYPGGFVFFANIILKYTYPLNFKSIDIHKPVLSVGFCDLSVRNSAITTTSLFFFFTTIGFVFFTYIILKYTHPLTC